MFTDAELTAASATLVAGKLSVVDVDRIVSAMKMFFGPLTEIYEYDWSTGLLALDDTIDPRLIAAQVKVCLTRMIDLDFGVASKAGITNYAEKDDYFQYIQYIHTKLYPMPSETFSTNFRMMPMERSRIVPTMPYGPLW